MRVDECTGDVALIYIVLALLKTTTNLSMDSTKYDPATVSFFFLSRIPFLLIDYSQKYLPPGASLLCLK